MQNDIIKKARENLMTVSYGKFDLIETVFPMDVLLSTRPRQLRKMIAEKLEVPTESIPYKTFMSWLSRLRSKSQRVRGFRSPSVENVINKDQKQTGEKDWRAFSISSSLKQETSDEVLLNYPTYD